MTIKKQFEEIYAFLEANKNKKVATIFDDVIALMSSKSGGSDIGKTFIKNDAGEVIGVYCYYHKKWEAIRVAEYGVKTNTATGLNTMCKEGVSSWSKQQRIYKKANEELLKQVASGELSPEDLQAKMDELEVERKSIEVRNDEHGFDTAEEFTAWFNAQA